MRNCSPGKGRCHTDDPALTGFEAENVLHRVFARKIRRCAATEIELLIGLAVNRIVGSHDVLALQRSRVLGRTCAGCGRRCGLGFGVVIATSVDLEVAANDPAVADSPVSVAASRRIARASVNMVRSEPEKQD